MQNHEARPNHARGQQADDDNIECVHGVVLRTHWRPRRAESLRFNCVTTARNSGGNRLGCR